MRFIFTLSFRLISKGRYRNSDVARVLLLAWSNEQSLKKLLTKKRTNNNRSQPTHTCIHIFRHMVRYINRQKREREKKKLSISLFFYKFDIYIFCLWNYPFAFLTQLSTYFLNLNYSLIHMKIEKRRRKER